MPQKRLHKSSLRSAAKHAVLSEGLVNDNVLYHSLTGLASKRRVGELLEVTTMRAHHLALILPIDKFHSASWRGTQPANALDAGDLVFLIKLLLADSPNVGMLD